ncbi:hypothetical protein EDD37DRAFT_606085 [Exophiala viscosa]|uniref:uncharacterized protein n=1 Tax=Exophiala viscosa TaxID=2486360 RepID=UPI00219CAF97|nr:hypothetical protein EDD37DRAFT_606085 [Exophiala viscosa]
MKSEGGRRKKLQRAVRTLWEKEDIKRLEKDLDDIQRLLQTAGLVHNVNKSRRCEALTKEQAEKLHKLCDECHLSFDDIRRDVAELKGLVNDEGSVTRKVISEQATSAERRVTYERLLDSLAFEAMNSRSSSRSLKIEEGTFEHLLVEKVTGDWDCFIVWLRTGNGLYWVNGKPGSGKSTLMKFLIEHDATMRELLRWTKGKERFGEGPKGYLLTILHQAWMEDEDVVTALIQHHPQWKKKRSQSDWSPKQLEEALKTTFQATGYSYCIFVDGIDECGNQGTGSQDEVLDHIDTLGQKSNIKFCVSSRPETIFRQRLNQYPKLRLQDLNRIDIELFVEKTFERRLGAGIPMAVDDYELSRLRRDLSNWSEGIFLWVRLAVKTALDGIRNNDNLEELKARLQQVAGNLEALYQNMWDRLNEGKKLYRTEASLILNHVLACLGLYDFGSTGAGKCSVLDVLLLLDRGVRQTHLELGTLPSHIELRQKCESVEHRVLTPTDVSEMRTTRTSGQPHMLKKYYYNKIRLIHRTARDFLLDTQASRELLSHHPWTRAEALAVYLQTELVALRTGIITANLMKVVRFLQIMRLAELGVNSVPLLNGLDLACTLDAPGSGSAKNAKHWVLRLEAGDRPTLGHSLDFVGLVVEHGHLEYLDHISGGDFRQFGADYLDYLMLLVSNNRRYDPSAPRDADVQLPQPRKTLEHFIELGGSSSHIYWPGRGPVAILTTPWIAFMLNTLRCTTYPKNAYWSWSDYAAPRFLESHADISTNFIIQNVWRMFNNVPMHDFVMSDRPRHYSPADISLSGYFKEHLHDSATPSMAQQHPFRELSMDEFEDRLRIARYIPQYQLDRTVHEYVVWFEVNGVFVVHYIQRKLGRKWRDLGSLDSSSIGSPHQEPLCVCLPSIDVAALPSPDDSMALVEAYEAMEESVLRSDPFERECHQKVKEIFGRSRKVDMCRYLLAKGYIKHPGDPEVLREAPPMFREDDRNGSEEDAEPAIPDAGSPGMEDKDSLDGDLDVSNDSDPEIKPFEKRMTDLSIYYDANETFSDHDV